MCALDLPSGFTWKVHFSDLAHPNRSSSSLGDLYYNKAPSALQVLKSSNPCKVACRGLRPNWISVLLIPIESSRIEV